MIEGKKSKKKKSQKQDDSDGKIEEDIYIRSSRINSYVQWNVYQNLRKFCEVYAKYIILESVMVKSAFIKGLQFDNYVKLTVKKKDNVILLFFIIESVTGQLIQILSKQNDDIIIVYPVSIEKLVIRLTNKFSKKNIKLYNYNKFKLEIPKYPGAPKYKILDDKEVNILLDNFKCDKMAFTKINEDDPLAIWYMVKKNDLIEITYASETIHQCIQYAVCK